MSTTIYLRNIPEKVTDSLKRAAERKGQSLNKFIADELAKIASINNNQEVIDELRARIKAKRDKVKDIPREVILEAIAEGRREADRRVLSGVSRDRH
ncbi:MAG: antitoxin [Microbacteriaceae bacterium]|nr:antitoxin [Microbacteriaceae bacterium]